MRQISPFAIFCGLLAVAPAGAESIPEPGSVFYGKVLVPSGGGHYQLTEGEMSWSIALPDGAEVVLQTRLEEVGGGRFSYRLTVPHSVAAGGGTGGAGDVALGSREEAARHVGVVIDGEAARFAVGDGGEFPLSQALRASTYRVDLEVGLELTDSDGDGIADWWEDRYDLDPFSDADAGLDGDGDGVDNLAEFLAGSDPTVDNRRPEIVTRALVLYAGVANGVQLEVSDSDTPAVELRYGVVAVPDGVELSLDHEDDGARELGEGASFDGEDLQTGRVRLRIAEDAFESGSLKLQVRDAAESESGSEAEIVLSRASVGERDARKDLLILARDEGRTVWDLRDRVQAVDLSLSARGEPNLVLAGRAGGTIGGSAQDDRVSFFEAEPRRSLSVEGFRDGGLDQLELTPAFESLEGDLRESVRLEGTEALIASALTVNLPGNEAALRELWEGRHLLAEGLTLPPLVRIASVTNAGENGLRAGGFTVVRSGDTSEALAVGFGVRGSATSGVDYASLGERVTIPAGQATATVVVTPYADGLTEQNEVVELELVEGPGYELGSASGQLLIVDLMPEIRVEALEPVASVAGGQPGIFHVRRSGLVDRSVLVRLRISGTATSGTDYQPIPSYLQLAASETSATILVTPLPGAAVAAGESVNLTVLDDPSYLSGGGEAAAAVVIVAERRRFADIAAAEPGLTLEAFLRRQGHEIRKAYRRDGALFVEFPVLHHVSDLESVVEYSEDLKTWRAGGEYVEEVTPLWEAGDVGRAVYRAVPEAPPGAEQFLRVVVRKR